MENTFSSEQRPRDVPKPSFEQLPNEIFLIRQDLSELKQLFLDRLTDSAEGDDRWFDLDEAVAYDPEKRTKPTWYGLVSKKRVPYHKKGKKLYFLKSEIDEWLKSGRRKTKEEISAGASDYLKERRGKNG